MEISKNEEINSNSFDILKELSVDDCLNYLKILKNNQPENIYSHHHLYNHIRYLKYIKNNLKLEKENELSDRCRTRIFGYRYGKLENCTLIGISGIKDYWLQLFTLDETGQELFKCLNETNLINWNIRPISGIIQKKFSNKINEIFKMKNLHVKQFHHDTVVWVSKHKLMELDICIPNDVYIGPLQPHHAEFINDKWTHNYPNSLKYIESCIKLNGGTGLFKINTNELIAWDLTSENYTSGFLYTIESERRKGYGKIVCAIECKRIAERDNIDIYGFVLQGNIASERLVKEIGFIPVNHLDWFEQDE